MFTFLTNLSTVLLLFFISVSSSTHRSVLNGLESRFSHSSSSQSDTCQSEQNSTCLPVIPKKKRSKACKKKTYNKNAIQNSNIFKPFIFCISILTSSTIRIIHRFRKTLPPALEVAALMLSVLVGAERRLEKVRPGESRLCQSRHLGDRYGW